MFCTIASLVPVGLEMFAGLSLDNLIYDAEGNMSGRCMKEPSSAEACHRLP